MDNVSLQLFGNARIGGNLILGTWNMDGTEMEVKMVLTDSIKVTFGLFGKEHDHDLYIPCNVWLSKDGKLTVKSPTKDGTVMGTVEKKFEFVNATTWRAADEAVRHANSYLPYGTASTVPFPDVELSGDIAHAIKLHFRPNYLEACKFANRLPVKMYPRPSLIGEIVKAFLHISFGAPSKATFVVNGEKYAEVRDDIRIAVDTELAWLYGTKWNGLLDQITSPYPKIIDTITTLAADMTIVPMRTDELPYVQPDIKSSVGLFVEFGKPSL